MGARNRCTRLLFLLSVAEVMCCMFGVTHDSSVNVILSSSATHNEGAVVMIYLGTQWSPLVKVFEEQK